MKPSIGRIVHYVGVDRAGKLVHLPAIIVSVTSDVYVNLRIFLDSPGLCIWMPGIMYCEDSDRQGTWHWPERD